MLSVSESKNIQSDLLPKIGTGFCGGLSRTCGPCGAVIGSVVAINIFYGRNKPADPLDKSYPPVQKFVKEFENMFGSTNCRQLIDCDLGTEEGRKKFTADNIIIQCKIFTAEATKMVMAIIDENS